MREGIEMLKGKTLTSINVRHDEAEIIFTTNEGEVFKMHHNQDCCESVDIDDIVGDIQDLVGEEIFVAEEVSNHAGKKSQSDESYLWTFYKIANRSATITIKWYGTSNGYYSEGVDFDRILEPQHFPISVSPTKGNVYDTRMAAKAIIESMRDGE